MKLRRYHFLPGATCNEDCHADMIEAAELFMWLQWAWLLSKRHT